MIDCKLCDPGYQSKRKEWFTTATYSLLNLLVHTIYKVSYENTDRLSDLKDEGFVLLPRHQCYLDIVLEDILLHEKIGKHGYFLMSSNLPKAFEWLGGVGITRKKDLEKLVKTSPSARLDKLEALKRKREANSEIINLLCRNEVVVVHFEGARHYRERVDPKKHRPNIRNLTDLQALLGRDIPFVPLDICYGNRIVYGTAPPPLSKILLRVGNPIRVVDGAYQELEEHLRNEIEDH